MADITVDTIDQRLAQVTAGLNRSVYDEWRLNFWLDLRLATAERARAEAEVPC